MNFPVIEIFDMDYLKSINKKDVFEEIDFELSLLLIINYLVSRIRYLRSNLFRKQFICDKLIFKDKIIN